MTTVRSEWATRELGLGVEHVSGSERVEALVRPGLRRNPKRAHLLVSTVLGKHIPARAEVVLGAGNRLAERVATVLAAAGTAGTDTVVFGFAETATSLGHTVAAALGARCYVHSTRRDVPGATVHARFEEGHSHATSHQVQPTSAALLAGPEPLVLVDDEISTGATAWDAIRALHATFPRERYIVASLVDMRSDEHRARCAREAAAAGLRVDFVSLAQGRVDVPAGLTDRVLALDPPELGARAARAGSLVALRAPWPSDVPDGGRHGFLASDTAAFEDAVAAVTDTLAPRLDPHRPVLVIGHEESMYLPLRVAAHCAVRGFEAYFQTTTRSPAYVHDGADYPLRRGFRFAAPEPVPEDDSPDRYLYNAAIPDGQIVVVVDAPADTDALRSGLLDALTTAGEDVVLVVVPGAQPHALAATRAAAPEPGTARAEAIR